MKCEKGVELSGLKYEMRPALIAANTIYLKYDQELFITCTDGGIHSAGSLHYYGYAMDLRTKFFKDQATKQKVADDIRAILPFPFDVVLESTHLNLEYDVTKLTNEVTKMEEKEFWRSKKFWVAVAAALIPGVNAAFGLGLQVEVIAPMVGSLMSYVVGQGIADLGKNKAD